MYIDRATRHHSFLAALMISYNLLAVIMKLALQLDIPYGNILALFIISLVIIFSIINQKIYISIKQFIFLGFILTMILTSWAVTGINTSNYILSFGFFGIFGYYIGIQKINTELLLRYLIYISYLPLFFINSLIELNYSSISSFKVVDMGISYALLPLGVATFLHLIYYRKSANLIVKVAYLFNFFLVGVLMFMGTRGALLSLLLAFIFILANKQVKEKDKYSDTKLKKRTWLIWISIISSIILIAFYNQIILALYNYFSHLGVSINFIDKSVRLIASTGDSTNGRMNIWNSVVTDIAKSPIWGHGLGAYFLSTGYDHPHNIVLELMHQGGFLLTIPIILPIILGIHKFAMGKVRSIDVYVYAVLLISSCLPRLLVSSSLWGNQIFWMLFGFMNTRLKFLK